MTALVGVLSASRMAASVVAAWVVADWAVSGVVMRTVSSPAVASVGVASVDVVSNTTVGTGVGSSLLIIRVPVNGGEVTIANSSLLVVMMTDSVEGIKVVTVGSNLVFLPAVLLVDSSKKL